MNLRPDSDYIAPLKQKLNICRTYLQKTVKLASIRTLQRSYLFLSDVSALQTIITVRLAVQVQPGACERGALPARQGGADLQGYPHGPSQLHRLLPQECLTLYAYAAF